MRLLTKVHCYFLKQKIWFTISKNIWNCCLRKKTYIQSLFLKFCSACMPRASKNNSHRKWARKYFRYEVYQVSCTRFLVYLGIYRRMILSFVVHWITLKRMVCKGHQNFSDIFKSQWNLKKYPWHNFYLLAFGH